MSDDVGVIMEEYLDGVPKSEYEKLNNNEKKIFRKNVIIQRIEKGGMKYIFEEELANFFDTTTQLIKKEVKQCISNATIVDLKALKINLNSKFEKNFELLDKAATIARDARELSMVVSTINQTIASYTNFLEKHNIKPVEHTEVSDDAKKGAITLLSIIGKSQRPSSSSGGKVIDVEIGEK